MSGDGSICDIRLPQNLQQASKFNNPIFEIINNVTAKPEQNADKIKNLLIDQIFSTVKWRQSLINMSQKGVKTFIEIGPGKALTAFAWFDQAYGCKHGDGQSLCLGGERAVSFGCNGFHSDPGNF